MLTLREVRLRRGPRVLFEDANLAIFRGEKVGVVGRNGSGKSSLLSLIRGELSTDLGEYDAPSNQRIASVAQSVPDSEEQVVEFVRSGDLELIALEQAIESARARDDGAREAALFDEYDAAGGYTSRSRAAAIATGLGFAPQDIERPLREFSGGLRMRASLARALMRRSDMLLLDEPTNHLDLDAVLWLEGWLRAYRGTLLIVSHDREFLDAIVNRIVHIGGERIADYAGNYSSFERQAAEARSRSASLAERQQRERAHVESFVDRFRAKASKARQVQSRLKWLERLPQIVEGHDEESFDWSFAAPRKLPRPLVRLEDVAAGYGESTRIIGDVNLSIDPGDRIGILGRNGAGKSTLMKTLAGLLDPLAGEREAAPDLALGYFAQLEVEQFDATGSSIEELGRRGGDEVARWSPQQKRDHLGRFGFRGDRVFEPIATFSGGERARLTLAVIVARRPNLLLLDEPTNHLDFDMRNALLLALQDYAGAVVMVSHDRSLLRGACDSFLVVRDGEVQPFDGDLEDYAAWLASSPAAGVVALASSASPKRRERERVRQRNPARPSRRELDTVEAQMQALGAQKAAMEAKFSDGQWYSAASLEQQRSAQADYTELASRLTALEERWLSLSEAHDAIGQ